MTNHVHLLVTPAETGAVSRMMQWLGSSYVSYINVHYRRTGTLWEGRYKSCLVASDDYLLICYRYIELNPVRASIVDAPGLYPWSSYPANALGSCDALIHAHDNYRSLGATPLERQLRYRELFSDEINAQRLLEIRTYSQQQRALGGSRFQLQIEAALGRYMAARPAHRPRTADSWSENGD